jgi:hypothetical protein
MTKILRLLLLPLVLVPAFHASAADSEEERTAAARRYLDVAQMSKITDDMVTELARSIPTEQRGRFLQLMHDALHPDVLEQAALGSMVKIFTADELNALADFYGSPLGRSAMGKFGVYMADVMPVIQQEMFRALRQLSVDK